MPVRTNEIKRSDLKEIYDIIMADLYIKYPDPFWVKIKIGKSKTDIPAFLIHGKVAEIFNEISAKCGLLTDSKGGAFYDFHLFMRPKKNKVTDDYEWPSPIETKKFGGKFITGIFDYIKNEKLIPKIDEDRFKKMRSDLTEGLFDYSIPKISKSLLSPDNKRTLEQYRMAPTSEGFPVEWITRWISYERTTLGISKSTIEFEEQGGVIFAIVKTIYKDLEKSSYPYTYKGIAFKDSSGEYIIVKLFREEDYNIYASFIMRLDRVSSRGQKLSVGYASYFSIRYKRFLNKIVAWELFDESKSIEFEPKDIPIFKNPKDKILDEEYKSIDIVIRRFLKDREKTRLSMPRDLITRVNGEMDSLQNWINTKLTFSEKDQITNDLLGNYYLFYFSQESKISRKNKELKYEILTIEGDERLLPGELSPINAKLNHNAKDWSGQVERNSNVLQLNLIKEYGTRGIVESEPSKIISLMIHLKNLQEDKSYKPVLQELNFLKGIGMGLNENGIIPVADKICLVDKEKFENNRKALEQEIRKELND